MTAAAGSDRPCSRSSMINYEIEIRTADVPHAGTSAVAFVTLVGEAGETERLTIHGGFKRATPRTIKSALADVGRLTKLRVEHDNSGLAPGWMIEEVKVRKIKESHTFEDYHFPCKRWLARDEDDSDIVKELFPKQITRDGKTEDCHGKATVYQLKVHTGKEKGAGTDAKVFCTLYGELGNSGERQLYRSSDHKDKFERGQTDTFDIRAVGLGVLNSIRVRHDNSGLGADWQLDSIVVQDMDDNKDVTFKFADWLSVDRGGQLNKVAESTRKA